MLRLRPCRRKVEKKVWKKIKHFVRGLLVGWYTIFFSDRFFDVNILEKKYIYNYNYIYIYILYMHVFYS